MVCVWDKDNGVGGCQSTSQVRSDTPMTPPSRCAALGRCELELVSLPGKALTLDAMRRLWFVIHVAGWPYSVDMMFWSSTVVPVTSTVVPVTSTVVPMTSTVVPMTSTVVPVTSTVVPMTSTVVPVTSTVCP